MYYFVSDVHLGAGTPQEAKSVEERFVKWLDSVGEDAEAIFICGDLFDFWYEYKRVVPKGFVRTLGRIAHLTDRGVRVVFMAGNHDQWLRDYFEVECGMEIYTRPKVFELAAGKRVHIAHGDGLNVKRDPILKAMNNTFRSSWVRALFSTFVHPDLALKFGQWWSRSSRAKHINTNYEGQEFAIEALVEYAMGVHADEHADYYVFGHLHAVEEYTIGDQGEARVIFVNDWRVNPHCAVMDAEGSITIKEI